jgi:murein DD-endopeptidase MepM/ murein hydrolase activator NlpD
VEENFRIIEEITSTRGYDMPPMTNPLKNYSVAQTGASTGSRINPFYKVQVQHNGLDMIAHSGEPVYASADGVVRDVTRSRKGLGNVVEIDHGNGYVTRYAHLADIEVRKGRRLKRGDRIGYVGVSGNSFAPHLHYEVLRDTLVLDPVNHMFASVTPEEYINMLVMSVSTGQSMD